MEPNLLANDADRLISWTNEAPRRWIERWEPERLGAVEELCHELRRSAAPDQAELAVCFLGNAGVGKSTLINSLVDPQLQVVPQGGVGPLTAQATVVRYAEAPYLRATYHGPRRVNQLVFALDRACERQRGLARQAPGALDAEDERAIELELPLGDAASTEPAGESADDGRMQSYISQARQLVTGRPLGGDHPVEYFADCLRGALGNPPRWGHTPADEHRALLTQVVEAIELGEAGHTWERAGDPQGFLGEVARHASGSIAPLIKSLEVGWPAAALRDGLVLVDLPGIGIANDEYRSVTSAWIRRATAVVLVVDRSGVTDASVELLRTTGFLNSILHRAPDSTSVSPLLRVVAVKLDDVATASRATFKAHNPGVTPPPWLELFRRACDDSRQLIQSQLQLVLEQSIGASPAETRDERGAALRELLTSLQVYPVSAIEYRKLHEDDDADRPKIKDADDSNIPALAGSLSGLARQHAGERAARYRATAHRLFDAIERALARAVDELSGDERRLARVAELREALEVVIRPAADELMPRLGGLRERLRGTIPKVIENEVERAIRVADSSIREYLVGLRKLNWSTLRATVRRGGVWVRSRPIDLPNEVALRFEEPLALAWRRGVVGPLQRALGDFAKDLGRLLGTVVEWAAAQPELDVAHVERFRADVASELQSLAARGATAAEELTRSAKLLLHTGIQDEIRVACQQFQDEGHDVGAGVKGRVSSFLEQLAPRIAQVARVAASQFFRDSYDGVLTDVAQGIQRFDDPLVHARNLLLGGAERSVRDASQRLEELSAVRVILRELSGHRDGLAA